MSPAADSIFPIAFFFLPIERHVSRPRASFVHLSPNLSLLS